MPETEAAAIRAGGEMLLERTREAAGQDTALRDNIEMTVEGATVLIGVPDRVVQHPDTGQPVNIGQVAADREFGTSAMQPEPLLSSTMFQHGQEAASLIGGTVAAALAGELAPVRSAPGVGTGPPRRRRGLLA